MSRIIVGGYRPSPSHHLGLGPPRSALEGVPPSACVELPAALQQCWQDCVANAVAIAVQAELAAELALVEQIELAAALSRTPLPSRRWGYYWGRSAIGEIGCDGGCCIHDVMQALADLGYPAETDWPYVTADEVRRDELPDRRVKRLAFDQRVVRGGRRITSTWTTRALDVRCAIAAGSVVIWGTQLDQAFCDLQAGQAWPGRTGPSLGGHAMVLHAYERGRFLSRSSWGSEFADGGSAWVSDVAVMSDEAEDFWTIDATLPPFTGTK